MKSDGLIMKYKLQPPEGRKTRFRCHSNITHGFLCSHNVWLKTKTKEKIVAAALIFNICDLPTNLCLLSLALLWGLCNKRVISKNNVTFFKLFSTLFHWKGWEAKHARAHMKRDYSSKIGSSTGLILSSRWSKRIRTPSFRLNHLNSCYICSKITLSCSRAVAK